MLVSLPIIIAFLIVVGIPPIRLSKKFIEIHWWDYALPAVGLPVWIFLAAAEVGNTASLSNMVTEVIIVIAISVVIPWTRFMILFFWKKTCFNNLSNYVFNSVCHSAPSQDLHANIARVTHLIINFLVAY